MTTYPADYLHWLERLDSRFNITAGHIWEAAQKYERERIKSLFRQSDEWFEEDQQAQAKWVLEKIDVPE